MTKESHFHCTLAVVRSLTKPLLFPPSADNGDLQASLLLPWDVRVPVDPEDDSTRYHWKDQKHTELFHKMFDWEDPPSLASENEANGVPNRSSTASLHPYFTFGSPSSPFFAPWEDVANCLKHLLLHRIASHHEAGNCVVLTSQEIAVFIATSANFQESSDLERIRQNLKSRVKAKSDPNYYLLRCHYEKQNMRFLFGYHSSPQDANSFRIFHTLLEVSLLHEDWRLTTCIIMKNLVRIIHCLQDYGIPLVWSSKRKLSLVSKSRDKNGNSSYVQKVYETENICNIFNATVTNMISVYKAIEDNNIPHTDRLVVVEEVNGERICKFTPIGRAYLPQNLSELLDALICVGEALLSMHKVGIMHRDIRWANILHVMAADVTGHQHSLEDSHEWALFDFEFAAFAPQPAFGLHTLTPGNHAPEMLLTAAEGKGIPHHGLATDIWGLGFLLLHASVDIPVSHEADLKRLQSECLEPNPANRPTAAQCLDILRDLRKRPPSTEKELMDP